MTIDWLHSGGAMLIRSLSSAHLGATNCCVLSRPQWVTATSLNLGGGLLQRGLDLESGCCLLSGGDGAEHCSPC